MVVSCMMWFNYWGPSEHIRSWTPLTSCQQVIAHQSFAIHQRDIFLPHGGTSTTGPKPGVEESGRFLWERSLKINLCPYAITESVWASRSSLRPAPVDVTRTSRLTALADLLNIPNPERFWPRRHAAHHHNMFISTGSENNIDIITVLKVHLKYLYFHKALPFYVTL